ncbi:6595_t:CDS:2 [Entrophospora sp. SA101]|nr:6595_t:CDS:2 [Entrophospora sp. SA101]
MKLHIYERIYDKINNVSIIIASDRNSFVKRYGTYDLNRSKDVDSTATFSDSAQAANFSSSSLINHSLSKLTFQQHQTSVNKNSSSISKKSESSTKILSPINTSNFDNTITTNLDDIPQSPYGGIKVTTVVEVLNSPIKNEFENEVASSTTPKVNQFRTSTSSTKSKKRNSRPENIYTSVNDLLVSNGERKREKEFWINKKKSLFLKKWLLSIDENITIEDDKINNVSIIIASDRNSFVKRYGTYDLNRSKDVDSTATFSDSAQAANFSSSSLINHSLSKLTFQQHQTSVNKNSSSISKKSESSTKILSPINTSNFDNTITTNLDDIPQSPYGGIKVTTVVEVLNSPIKNEFENEVASSTTPKVNQFRTSTSSTKSKKRNSRPENIYTSVNDLLVSNGERKRVKNLKIGNKRKGILDKQKEIIIPKEMAFIDPKLLTHGNLVRIPSNRRLKRINSNIHRKKIPKNMEYAPTSNPTHSNDPTDIDADLPQKNSAYPWLPELSKPPQLLHASLVPLPHCSTSSSLISNVNNTLMMTNTSTEENNKNNIGSSDNNNTNCNSKMLTIDQKHNSKISTSNFLSRKNSLRKRTSLIQSSNRASLIFRRQLLEESIMMSFGKREEKEGEKKRRQKDY